LFDVNPLGASQASGGGGKEEGAWG